MMTRRWMMRGTALLLVGLTGAAAILLASGSGGSLTTGPHAINAERWWEKPLMNVRLAKAKFSEGEPIGVEVSILNYSSKEIAVELDYPRFRSPSTGRSPFDWPDTGLKIRIISNEQKARDELGGLTPLVRIPPGDGFTTTTYLQRYIESPNPGEYHIPYHFEVGYITVISDENGFSPLADRAGHIRHAVLKTAGELRVKVTPKSTENLMNVLDNYLDNILINDRWSWKKHAAVEAISVMDDRIVVPTQIRLLEEPGLVGYGLEALSRHPEDRRALAAVLECLDPDRYHPSDVAKALDVLSNWDYKLKPEVIQRLQKRDEHLIRQAMSRYFKAVSF